MAGSWVFDSLRNGLNTCYSVDKSCGFGKQRLAEATMLAMVGLVFPLAVASGLLIDELWSTLRFLPVRLGPAFRSSPRSSSCTVSCPAVG